LASGIPIILFFGSDGTGKTTQTKRLISYLRQRGFKVKHVWIRGHHTASFLLFKLLTLLRYRRQIYTSNDRLKTFDPLFFCGLERVWEFIEFVSVLPLIFFKLELPRLLKYIIVADRCVVDTIVFIAYLIRDYNFLYRWKAKFLLKLIPRNAVLVHLYADTTVILKRKKFENLTSDFIDFQRKAYGDIAEYLGALSLDTSQRSEEDTFKTVLDLISSRSLEK
jgi:hypothetical protein